ncbi:MAG: FIST C-terminal domain-containing protein [Synergistaceae bacterium]|jgi:hypothetical protein|nr:FIST C-terminal domain-containing protein [Synergistaceae bacterium]
MLCAYTEEIDEIGDAVEEIAGQIDFTSLLPNSVGVVSCYREFLETGVVQAIAKRMPFDIVGATTLANGTSGHSGNMLLCLSVITSDDVRLAAVMSEALSTENYKEPIAGAYKRAVEALGERPKLLIPFLPLIPNVGAEAMLTELEGLSGKAPMFGMIACDKNLGLVDSATILNGRSDHCALAMLAISGDIHPRFFVSAISEDKIQKQKAIITSSEGNLLKEVNDMPLMEYFRTIGLTFGDGLEGINAIPLVVDYNDGTKPLVRAAYMVTEEGYAPCGGEMPNGGTLSIGFTDTPDILRTAKDTLEAAAEYGKNGMLIMPCLARYLELAADPLAELEYASQVLGDMPYHMCYSGGEICPVYGESGEPVNRFHNFTFIACAF